VSSRILLDLADLSLEQQGEICDKAASLVTDVRFGEINSEGTRPLDAQAVEAVATSVSAFVSTLALVLQARERSARKALEKSQAAALARSVAPPSMPEDQVNSLVHSVTHAEDDTVVDIEGDGVVYRLHIVVHHSTVIVRGKQQMR
jgi:hypothetical protein